MNPIKTFLFLFFTIGLFLSVQYIRNFPFGNDVSVSYEEKPDTLAGLADLLVTEPIQTEVAFSDQEEDSTETEKMLFYPQPLLFSPDDTVRFDFLVRKMKDTTNRRLPVRIVYFGDSQIENDRITSSLRKKLQQKFGGKGVGLIPLVQIYSSPNQFMLEPSKEWKIQTYQDGSFLNRSVLFRNSLLAGEDVHAGFRIKRLKHPQPNTDYDLMKIYYRLLGDCQLEIVSSKEIIYQGALPSEDSLEVLDLSFNKTPDDINLNFKCDGELDVLGISLESEGGVLVDNVALRGLSYPLFEWSDQEFVEMMVDRLNVGLFVFHFGVNLVPYASDDYRYFRQHFERQVHFLKENFPEVPILIIGVSDMARKVGGDFESYPNIQQIKAIQKEVAEQNHTAFWDLEAFMGGKGGMGNWVNATPPLGRSDYAHFSKEGASLVGKELAQLIILLIENDSISVK